MGIGIKADAASIGLPSSGISVTRQTFRLQT
jgi:hypothetical protein